MTGHIVIARYQEDLDWVGAIPQAFRVTVYNKGPEIASEAVRARAQPIVALPNSGRESDTILRHLLATPPAGDGHTVFLQGDPFEHSPDIIQLLAAADAWSDLQPLSWRWRPSEDLPPADILDRENAGFLAGARIRPELFSLTTWNPVQFADPGTKRIHDEYRALHDLPGGINMAAHFLRRCAWHDLADQAGQHLIGCFAYGAMFAVRQHRLAALPRASLEFALQAANAHPMYGYILERLWLHMMGEPFRLPAPAPALYEEDIAALPLRFIARPPPPATPPPAPVPALHRRVLPALKRRVVQWVEH